MLGDSPISNFVRRHPLWCSCATWLVARPLRHLAQFRLAEMRVVYCSQFVPCDLLLGCHLDRTLAGSPFRRLLVVFHWFGSLQDYFRASLRGLLVTCSCFHDVYEAMFAHEEWFVMVRGTVQKNQAWRKLTS